MSVQCNHYVVLGVKLRYPRSDGAYEKFEPFKDSAFKPHKPGRFGVLLDGMNGKYMIAGRILASTENYDGFDKPIEISCDNPTDIVESPIDEVVRALKEKLDLEVSRENVSYWVVSHYR